ncbi:unnamed protein product, partial [Larinioides sclopetarius]
RGLGLVGRFRLGSPTARKWRRPYACSDSPFYSRGSLLSPALGAHLPTKTHTQLEDLGLDATHVFRARLSKELLLCRVLVRTLRRLGSSNDFALASIPLTLKHVDAV